MLLSSLDLHLFCRSLENVNLVFCTRWPPGGESFENLGIRFCFRLKDLLNDGYEVNFQGIEKSWDRMSIHPRIVQIH